MFRVIGMPRNLDGETVQSKLNLHQSSTLSMNQLGTMVPNLTFLSRFMLHLRAREEVVLMFYLLAWILGVPAIVLLIVYVLLNW